MSARVRKLRFSKMEGAGNDYVCVDTIAHPFQLAWAPNIARVVSNRHYGIGGDGLIALAASEKADVRMIMWNADGSRGAMCGNGIRCIAKLAFDGAHVTTRTFTVESDVAVHDLELVFGDRGDVMAAKVDMGEVRVDPAAAVCVVDGQSWSYHRGDAGNPHAVVFCETSLDAVPVASVGRAFQSLAAYPDGVNVEFVRVAGEGLEQRTFERGSGETLACGSGATVAAEAARRTGRLDVPVTEVRLRGGTLRIHHDGSRLVMEGPARTVFCGEMPLP